jgi:hypothetical protein
MLAVAGRVHGTTGRRGGDAAGPVIPRDLDTVDPMSCRALPGGGWMRGQPTMSTPKPRAKEASW